MPRALALAQGICCAVASSLFFELQSVQILSEGVLHASDQFVQLSVPVT